MNDSALPDRVRIMEVGPRDGLQFEKKILPTSLKVDLITDLVAAGLKEIQVAAFVNPGIVPQMADADTLVAQLPKQPGVVYNGLALNVKGVERVAAAGLKSIEVSMSASEAHSLRNVNMTMKESAAQVDKMIRLSKSWAWPSVQESSVPSGTRVKNLCPLNEFGVSRNTI